MTLPFLGPITLAGFAHAWFFLFALVAAAVAVLYVVMLRCRRTQVLRFANLHILEQVARVRRDRWRHVSAALLVAALLLLTCALAGPTHDVRIPRDRAVVMLVIDVSESMRATDVAPSRLAAAQAAGKKFTDELTPGINLGLIAFGGSATVLVAPTTNRAKMRNAIDGLKPEERTATGEAIFTALQAISTADAIVGGGDGPPPSRIVLESDGKETVPSEPDESRGAFTAARAARDQGVPISTISFGTPDGYVDLNGIRQPVPVDDATLKKISEITKGQMFHASNLDQLNGVYDTLQQQIGYQTVPGDASAGWLRLAVLVTVASAVTALTRNRRLPA
ncbi:VWA domain-containing protein [Mycolicibacterium sp. 120266]|uniref:VWA domain-containing protein n=1 Tax=Mycolicibacterium sp. 120266 TaxID=3090601 RepID=UPI00299CEB07|nr:VWA domain-containing protein [Mycolicibacterium sp. 120266]MDX1870949.1 VWA domain-containing protein [Mycolicibacterium sp. 120266]